jgi:hypothetical protein
MLYLGHFSFDETTEEGRFGHFTSLVEAKNPEAATLVFKKLIKDMRDITRQDIFSRDDTRRSWSTSSKAGRRRPATPGENGRSLGRTHGS